MVVKKYMLFSYKPVKVIILGLNNISLKLAKDLSIDNDVIILYETNSLDHRYREEADKADIIIKKIESSLVFMLMRLSDIQNTTFISVTREEKFNLFAAQLAKKMGAKFSLSLVYRNDYYDLNFDIDLIFNPYQIITDHINIKILKYIGFLNIDNLIFGKIDILSIKVKNNSPFSYLKIKNINLEQGRIIVIDRDRRKFLPDSHIQILPGDIIYVIFKRGFNNWIKYFNLKQISKRKFFIFGGRKIGQFIVNYWKDVLKQIIIIEPSLKQCNVLASRLEKPLILNGEGTEFQLIRQEGLNKSSIFLATSLNDLKNLVSSFGAKKHGCKTVVPLINKSSHREIANLLKLNNSIFIPELVTNYVLYSLKVKHKINNIGLGRQIRIIKINLNKNSLGANKKIGELKLPSGILVGVIIRNGKSIIPKEENKLMSDDQLIVFCEKKFVSRIKHIF